MKLPEEPESTPKTKTQPQFFRYREQLTSVALEEASLTLVENDSAFGVLLSETTRAGRQSSETILCGVTLVRCRKKNWSQAHFDEASIGRDEKGVWTAEDLGTKRLFREPSLVPYRTIFVSDDDFSRLMEHLKENRLDAVFAFSQGLFGTLPGFDFDGDGLAVPDNYASAGRLLPFAEYVTEK